MRAALRVLGLLLLIGGLATCAVAATLAIGDEAFFRAGEALERHPDHVLFQGEYYAALLRHIAYILTAIVGGLLGIVGSAVLFGIHAILVRLDRLEASGAAVPRAS
ncbi:MAG: hypothetical protein IT293_20330 [Deltaproteobacteria bacterium]|nr:hypothetical protein [Deltaproteobacteria bacterium]